MMPWPIRLTLCLYNRVPALGRITAVDLTHAEWDQPVVQGQVVGVGQRLSATFRAAGSSADWEARVSRLRELEQRRDAPLRDFLAMPLGIECRICLTLQVAGSGQPRNARLQLFYGLVLDLQAPCWRPVVNSWGEGSVYPWLDISGAGTSRPFESWFEIVCLGARSGSGLPSVEYRREAAAKPFEDPGLS